MNTTPSKARTRITEQEFNDQPTAKLRLRSGEEIQIRVTEGPLGVSGFRLHIGAYPGSLIIEPSANNGITIMTAKGLVQEQHEVQAILAERDAKSKKG